MGSIPMIHAIQDVSRSDGISSPAISPCPFRAEAACTFARSSRDIPASEKPRRLLLAASSMDCRRIVIYEASTPEYFSHCPRSSDKSSRAAMALGGGREPRFCNKVRVVSDLCAISLLPAAKSCRRRNSLAPFAPIPVFLSTAVPPVLLTRSRLFEKGVFADDAPRFAGER